MTELIVVYCNPEAGSFADRQPAILDDERLRQKVIGKIEMKAEFAWQGLRRLVRHAEMQRRKHAEPAVALTASFFGIR